MLSHVVTDFSIGLATAFSLQNLLYCVLGVTLGNLIGVIPGIGALAAISMLFPITFHLDPIPALMMLGGIYYGTAYGGHTASILLNLPGTAASAVICLDGFPMAKQGRAGVALFMTTFASFCGGSIGIIIMMLFSPVIVHYGLEFGAPEFFSLMVMALIAASVISSGSPLRSIAMVVLGILLGMIGTDINSGVPRFTFGLLDLRDGISLVAVAMGLFGVAGVIAGIRTAEMGRIEEHISLRSMLPKREDLARSWLPMLRGAGIGAFFGALPGTGGTVATFLAYAVEKRIAKDPSRFGNGAIEGIVAPESANNAADQTAFIPMLTLGIPHSATMALMIGMLTIQGVVPGPTLLSTRPDMFWGLVMSFWIGNILLVILNVPLIGIWIRVLKIPYYLLYPAILVFVCIGVYSVNYNPLDVLTVLFFGALGYGMRMAGFPAAPLLLGFVLGPMVEENFRRAMLLSGGDFAVFVTRPFSLLFLAISLALLAWSGWNAVRPASTQGPRFPA